MALISSPYGVNIIGDQSGPDPRPQRMPNGIANQFGSNIFSGQPIKINPTTGTLIPVTAATDSIYGIFQGVDFTPLGSRPTTSPFWPAGMNYDPNYEMSVYFFPLWISSIRLQIQADGPINQIAMGSQFNFTVANLGNGSLATGISACTISATPVPAGQFGQLNLIEFFPGTGSTIGDAFTDAIYTIANPQIGAARLASIG